MRMIKCKTLSSVVFQCSIARFSSVTYFNKPPFTNKTYMERFKKVINSSHSVSPTTLIQIVQASRSLQRENNRSSSHHTCSEISKLFKDGVTNIELEETITKSFRQIGDLHRKTDIIRSYLLTVPRPESNRSILEVMKLYAINCPYGEVDKKLVFSALRVMIENNDFESCFQLIDGTLNSKSYVESHRKSLFLLGSAITCSWFWVFSIGFGVNPVFGILIMNLGFLLSLLNFKLAAYRIAHRTGIGCWYRLIHHDEFMMVNKIMIEFERRYDKNAGNSNHNNNVNDILCYKFNGLLFESENDQIELNNAKKFINKELVRRKLRLVQNDQEKAFKEYYEDSSASYEWVEPDQDPAELVRNNI